MVFGGTPLCKSNICNYYPFPSSSSLPKATYSEIPIKEKISTNLKVPLMEASKNVSSERNFKSSPSGIETLLSMLAAGSSGETKEQLLHFLGSTNLETINTKALKIMELISLSKSNGPTSVVSFVNGAWIDQLNSIRPSFSTLLEGVYRAEAKTVDFKKKEEVCREINEWASRSTQGLIDEILSLQDLGRDPRLILANALFFKAPWEYRFTCIENRKFHLLTKEPIEAPFMTHKRFHELKGASFRGFKLVRIPYESVSLDDDAWKFAMYIFLPNAKDGLVGLVQRFNKDSSLLDQEFYLKQGVLSDFWIPKFKFSHGFSATDSLKQLGLERMFMETGGELTKIVDDASSKLLYLSEILQKSCIEVNEEGSEAASVTYSRILCGAPRHGSKRRPEMFRFVADHPFMFLIREETSGATFFIGVVVNPLLG